MSGEKELRFFLGREEWQRGVDWYAARFDAARPVRGESTVGYSAYPRHQNVPERMHALIPDAKLIYLVRDPIARIISDYTQRYSDRRESRPLEQAVETLEGNDLVERSRYARQLERYLPYYPMERIRVVDSGSLRHDRRTVMRDLFQFLGVDPNFTSDRLDQVHHESRFKRRKGRLAALLRRVAASRPAHVVPPHIRRRIGYVVYRPFTRAFVVPPLAPATHARLEAFFAPEVARLRELTGLPLSDWSV